jgi:membrane-bound ClpP family serine protease
MVAKDHRDQVRVAALDSVVLAIACLITYMLVTDILSRVYALSRADDLIGGLWAVIATVFVFRDSYRCSASAAVSRIAATAVSFVLCLAYFAFLPFHVWALALLIGLSMLAVYLIGRPGDAAAAAITTAVVLVAGAMSPQHAGSSRFSAWPTRWWASRSVSPPPGWACA